MPDGADEPEAGIAVCLSGGGYRAMLFHLGALWRLNETKVLARVERVSSVSGGSIVAGILGVRWHALTWTDGVATNFVAEVADRVRKVAGTTIDAPAIAGGLLLPGDAASRVIRALDEVAFEEATLQDLPADKPRFVINATNLESGVLWRFSQPYMRDYRVGEVRLPQVPLAEAVAASAAFPPFLSPLTLDLRDENFTPGSGDDLQMPPYTDRVELSDGGVYDNLGLETAFKRYRTLLVSDGGGRFAPDPDPPNDWVRHLLRVMRVIDNQVRSLRKRQLIAAYRSGARDGAYWGIRSDIGNYQPDPPVEFLSAPYEATQELAEVPTRLSETPDRLQHRLINWGYAVCDAALRTHASDIAADAPAAFPFPEGIEG
ncbi:MAG: patatin-like phospholipase family protein [Chloroflexota bacterium]|nr:patatin-like phospholipase family protein [Chloroflexota bacterium]